MYETLILIDNATRIAEGQLIDALRASFACSGDRAPEISGAKSSVRLRWPDFSLEIHHSKEAHVLEESQDIAGSFAGGHAKAEAIAACSERIEIAGDDDPVMDHFNDYCFVVEAIEGLGTVYTFDQGSSSFMNI